MMYAWPLDEIASKLSCLSHKRPCLGHFQGVARPTKEREEGEFQILQGEKKRERREKEEVAKHFQGSSSLFSAFLCIFLGV